MNQYPTTDAEALFWSSLEWRLCREFQGMRDGQARNLWCDGFNRDSFWFDDQPRITGRVWIYQNWGPLVPDPHSTGDRARSPRLDLPRQYVPWEFTLLLPSHVRHAEEIDWKSLLPADDMTRWLRVDWERSHLEMEPAAAQIESHRRVTLRAFTVHQPRENRIGIAFELKKAIRQLERIHAQYLESIKHPAGSVHGMTIELERFDGAKVLVRVSEVGWQFTRTVPAPSKTIPEIESAGFGGVVAFTHPIMHEVFASHLMAPPLALQLTEAWMQSRPNALDD